MHETARQHRPRPAGRSRSAREVARRLAEVALALIAFALALSALAPTGETATAAPPARTTGFELAPVLQLVKREIAAVDGADEARPVLRIEEAHLDLDLIEVPGRPTSRLLVPAADFGGEGETRAKPALRRNLALDLMPLRAPPAPGAAAAGGQGAAAPGPAGRTDAAVPADDAAAGDRGGGGAPGPLALAIDELLAATRLGLAAAPAFDAKRIAIDLEFALERDPRGAPSVVVFAGARRIEPRTVQKLRLKLAAVDR